MSNIRFDGIDDDFDDYGDEESECEGCGEPYGEGQCPLCCGFVYACGSEQCDWCDYSDECAKYASEL